MDGTQWQPNHNTVLLLSHYPHLALALHQNHVADEECLDVAARVLDQQG